MLTDKLATMAGISPEVLTKIMMSLIVVVAIWLVCHLLLRIIWSKLERPSARYLWRKLVTYISLFGGSMFLTGIWIGDLTGIGTFLGLLSAGLAIALKEPLTCIGGWFFLMIRRPFRVGDRIEIGAMKGDVIDIGMFQFSILEIGNWVHSEQSTGRILEIPNGMVFTESIANYTLGFPYIWNEIPVLITFESDWKKAKQILDGIVNDKIEQLSAEAEKKVKEASQKFLIFYSKLTPIVYTSVEESGIMLTIRYMCKPHSRRGTTQEIWEAVLDEFQQNASIEFAYPTQRFYTVPADSSTYRPPATVTKESGEHKL